MFWLRNKKIIFLVRTLKCESPDLFIYLFYKVAFDQGMHCLHKEYSIKIYIKMKNTTQLNTKWTCPNAKSGKFY